MEYQSAVWLIFSVKTFYIIDFQNSFTFSAKWNKRPSADALRGWIVLIDEEAKVGSAYARQNKGSKAKSSRSDIGRSK